MRQLISSTVSFAVLGVGLTLAGSTALWSSSRAA